MTDEITFMDLASLLKITPDTPMEKLGTALNATIFDASNVAGTLKQKGLIEFTANYPGPNAIVITEAGKAAMQEAEAKSTSPTDALDESLLIQMSGGKRLPVELQNTLGLRPRDLAMRLYKLNKQNLITYELKNGGVELLLTEQGFLHAKGGGRPIQPPPPAPGQAMPPFGQSSPVPPRPGMPAQQAPPQVMQGAPQQPALPPHLGMPGTTPGAAPNQAAAPHAHAAGTGNKVLAIVLVIVIIAIIGILVYTHRI